MRKNSLPLLACPACGSDLFLSTTREEGEEVLSGSLGCPDCDVGYPILAGVAVLVEDVGGYLAQHVKGISPHVGEEEIPTEFRDAYLEAKEEIESEHIEEDLESKRVVSLYLMNHYLSAEQTGTNGKWWQAAAGTSSPLIETLVRAHWDAGPFAKIGEWAEKLSKKSPILRTVEIGCGVGGLSRVLSPFTDTYLGVDGSFSSILLARHLAHGTPYGESLQIPSDLLQGTVSRSIQIPPFQGRASVDFIVGEFEALPVKKQEFDLTIALNAIDMMPEPALLPLLQADLLKDGGTAIQSCPYIWHEATAAGLREILPSGMEDSASAVEWLYKEAGFAIEEKADHLPWLFLKHARQLEIYSVHVFRARKNS